MHICSLKNNYPELYNLYNLFIKKYPRTNKWKISRTIYHIINSMGDHVPKCICGNELTFDCYKNGYKKYCSGGCSAKNNKLVGNKNPMKNKNIVDKVMATKIKNNTIDVSTKVKRTLMRRYGVDNPMKINGALEKRQKTCIRKYNTDNYAKSNISKKKYKDRQLNYYSTKIGDEYVMVEYGNIMKILHPKCGTIFEITKSCLNLRINRYSSILCTKCNPISSNESELQREIKQWIESHGYNVTSNKRIIPPYELDIYIPEIKMAIEFNGLLWHSEYKVPKEYHMNKTNMCREKGIRLFHIWEDDWLYKNEIVKSIIGGYFNNNTKIHGRKCEIKDMCANDCHKFINDNHIQGFVPASVYYGLTYNNELVQIMSFKKHKDNTWEISRLCSKLNCSVVGGASRLFSHFVKNKKFNTLISYSLNDYFDGKVYKNLGMKYKNDTAPSYFYVDIKNRIRLSRQQFQKHKLIEQGFDPNKTESEIMAERGYFRIYNSGNRKFTLHDSNIPS